MLSTAVIYQRITANLDRSLSQKAAERPVADLMAAVLWAKAAAPRPVTVDETSFPWMHSSSCN